MPSDSSRFFSSNSPCYIYFPTEKVTQNRLRAWGKTLIDRGYSIKTVKEVLAYHNPDVDIREIMQELTILEGQQEQRMALTDVN